MNAKISTKNNRAGTDNEYKTTVKVLSFGFQLKSSSGQFNM
jgi:hypothetical protein